MVQSHRRHGLTWLQQTGHANNVTQSVIVSFRVAGHVATVHLGRTICCSRRRPFYRFPKYHAQQAAAAELWRSAREARMLTVAEALALPDRQLWGMGPVTVSGVLYANGLLCCLVDREGDPNGIL